MPYTAGEVVVAGRRAGAVGREKGAETYVFTGRKQDDELLRDVE